MSEPMRIQLNPAISGSTESPKPTAAPAAETGYGPNFSEALARAQHLRFSTHAQKRIQSRDIQLTDDNVSRLEQAVDKAEQKGGKSSLVLMDELAFIVNVRERLVVTAVDMNDRSQGVFTQIDTVVIAGSEDSSSTQPSEKS